MREAMLQRNEKILQSRRNEIGRIGAVNGCIGRHHKLKPARAYISRSRSFQQLFEGSPLRALSHDRIICLALGSV